MKCCGKTRATPFCPECGKKLDEHSALGGLLEHLNHNVYHHERMVKKFEECLRSDPTAKSSYRWARLYESAKATALKWKNWETSLLSLLAKKNA